MRQKPLGPVHRWEAWHTYPLRYSCHSWNSSACCCECCCDLQLQEHEHSYWCDESKAIVSRRKQESGFSAKDSLSAKN